MLLSIEITEAEIQAAVETKVRAVIKEQTNSLTIDRYIKEQVQASWRNAVDNLVKEVLGNSENLRASIAVEVERKLRAQIAAAVKLAAQGV
jgi:hypothetical protein